ncbi:hypothetical protein CHELA1G11_21717 [Hyphomicrobiales bacterium]|nr:hypothetical protein CHELA1G11_21717 [Hyphomicrobiales bacterium]CAH1695542.1 hypothetical protein CHELA1G2_22021 [Hyphomicrobiales bacterium]
MVLVVLRLVGMRVAGRLSGWFMATFMTAMPMLMLMCVMMSIMRGCRPWLTMMLFIRAVIVPVMLLSHLLGALTLRMMVILARRCRCA